MAAINTRVLYSHFQSQLRGRGGELAWGCRAPMGCVEGQTGWCHCDLVFSLVFYHFWEAVR